MVKLRQYLPRLAAGAFILNSGLSKRDADEQSAQGYHGMAAGTYSFLGDMDPQQFTKTLSTAEIALGAALVTPFVPTALVAPALVLTIGGLSSARVLGLRRLTEHVGERFALGEATAIPLPHPSGASGWLNAPENRRRLESALAVVREELGRLRAA